MIVCWKTFSGEQRCGRFLGVGNCAPDGLIPSGIYVVVATPNAPTGCHVDMTRLYPESAREVMASQGAMQSVAPVVDCSVPKPSLLEISERKEVCQ